MHIHGGMLSGNLAAGGSAAAEAAQAEGRAARATRERLLGLAAGELAAADETYGSANPEMVGLVQAWSGGAGDSSTKEWGKGRGDSAAVEARRGPGGEIAGVEIAAAEIAGVEIVGVDEEEFEPRKASEPVSFWA